MKKIFILILSAVLCISAASCESAENSVINENINQENQENQTEPDKIYEIIREYIVVGERTEWALSGVLTLPKDADGKVPAVVLVHGSGPHDMDSTLFENKPFRDIAEYLSSRGIAVIRYDKRTFTHGLKMVQTSGGSLTVYEETIEDAVLAAEILRDDSRIDGNKIFIAGLSLGGMLAPRIHAEGGNFAGIISLAGSPRSIHDISFDQQMAYWETMPESEDKDYALSSDYKEFYAAELERIFSLPDDEAKNTLVGGVSAYYYKDWDKILTHEYVNNINIPFLIMQGSADFQVYADKDFVEWQKLLAGRENATFKLYENLNHIFMQSSGYNITELEKEYGAKSNVDAQVLQDMADWIKSK